MAKKPPVYLPNGRQICGGIRRDGEQCRMTPVEGKDRCKHHGGMTPMGMKNAVKHGIYVKGFSAEELAILADVKVGEVDDEIRVCRIRLARALAAEKAAAETPDGLDLEQRSEETARGPTGAPLEDASPIEKRTFKKTDYQKIIDTLIARIESLEKTRSELLTRAAAGDGLEDMPVGGIKITVQASKPKGS